MLGKIIDVTANRPLADLAGVGNRDNGLPGNHGAKDPKL
jgi:hypothetical protein